MILGKIIGKSTTRDFKFKLSMNAKKFQFVQVFGKDHYILCQIIEIEKDENETIGYCDIVGYRENSKLKNLRYPLNPGNEVLLAEDNFVKEVLGLENQIGVYIGKLDGFDNLNVFLEINKMLTKHVSIFAKSGSGKSYTIGVLIEELLQKKVPVLIIDPHGEYSSLKYSNEEDNELMKKFGIEKKGFMENIVEFSPSFVDNKAKPLKLSNFDLSGREIVNILPTKLTNIQLGFLYSALKSLDRNATLDDLIFKLEMEEGSAKWILINVLEYVKKLDLFSNNFTNMQELVKPGKCSIINLRGVNNEIQEIIVYKILNDLFRERKANRIPPLFLVIEEAHNFIPERSFGEAKSSGIIRQIFSEGRKFGLGTCIISQRPSRVDKSAISQCGTQFILRVTNPHDIKALVNSIEGININTEKEISSLPIGTSIISGIVDTPLFVNIRPRMTSHGGKAVEILGEEKSFLDQAKDFDEQSEILPLINQKISLKDYKIMNNVKDVKVKLIPCVLFNCSDEEDFNLLFNLNNGEVVTNLEKGFGEKINFNVADLSKQQKFIFDIAIKLKCFGAAEVFAKSNMQFSDVYDVLKILTDRQFLIRDNSKYKINENYESLSNLSRYSFYGDINFSRIKFDELLESSFNTDEIKSVLSDYIRISCFKECFLVVYD